MSGAPADLACFLCGERLGDIKKLKFHLVLAHPKAHTCLFCIERKGWSSEFPSQLAYNHHYQDHHSGVIEQRAVARQQVKRRQREQEASKKQQEHQQTPSFRDQRVCIHCVHLPIFESGHERDRHLISNHHYDMCLVCRLVGPSLEVMVHVATHHPGQLCHLCGSQSPVFSCRGRVRAHLVHSHGQTHYSCPNCQELQPFLDLELWLRHLESDHNCSGERLRPMNRKRSVKRCQTDGRSELCTISGLRNDSHRDCHILSVLHLLAQTSLPSLLLQSPHVTSDPPEFHQFFQQYSLGSSFFPHWILRNPHSFGLTHFPDLPGDLLRLLLQSSSLASGFRTVLEWRFDCYSCRRFVKTRLDDFLLRIQASESASFEQHLKRFLTTRLCSCGAEIRTEPTSKSSGDFLFVEVDRSRSKQLMPNGGEEWQLQLYPLKLPKKCDLLGVCYTVFATINLNLDYAEGGHYTVNLLLEQDEVVQVHEEQVKQVTAGPTFDSTTVLVAMRKEEKEEASSSESDALYSTNKSDAEKREPCLIGGGNETKHEQSTEEEERRARETHSQSPPEEEERRARETHSQSPPEEEERQARETHSQSPRATITTAPTTLTGKKAAKENIMLLGDNLRIYLNDNEEVVSRYRREYLAKVEEHLNDRKDVVKDVSLKSLGGQVLESKIYKVQSLNGSRKRRKKLQIIQPGVIDHVEGAGSAASNEMVLNVPEETGQLR